MLLQLLEVRQPLLEINYDKTKANLFDKFINRIMDYPDSSFWNAANSQLGPDADWDVSPMSNQLTPEIKEELFSYAYQRCLKLDPTTGRANNPSVYTAWMLSRYINQKILLWEDMESVGELLQQYDKLKQKGVFKSMVKAGDLPKDDLALLSDINRIAGKSILHNTVTLGNDWLDKHTQTSAKEEFAKYLPWYQSGDIEIIYPCNEGEYENYTDVPGALEANIKDFTKNGMVLKLGTLEASVALFQRPTAWCTARPGNHYFDDYTGRGPLYAVVDYPNKKYYQFHRESDQFLDQSDNAIKDPFSIPVPLVQAASRAMGLSMRQLYARMGEDERGRLLTTMEAIGYDEPTMGSQLWDAFVQQSQSFSTREFKHILRLYVTERGNIPAPRQLRKIIDQRFANSNGLLEAAFAVFETCPPDKISEDLYNNFLDYAEKAPNLAFNYYRDTIYWDQLREAMVMRYERGLDIHYLEVYGPWAAPTDLTNYHANGNMEKMAQVYSALNLTPDEILMIVVGDIDRLDRNVSERTSMLMQSFMLYLPSIPQPVIDVFLKRAPEKYKYGVMQYVLGNGVKQYMHLIDIKMMLEAAKETEDLTPRTSAYRVAGLLTNALNNDDLKAQLDPEFMQFLFSGVRAFGRFLDVRESATFSAFLGEPGSPVAAAIKNGLVSSIDYIQRGEAGDFLIPLYRTNSICVAMTVEDDNRVFQHLNSTFNPLDTNTFRYCLEAMITSLDIMKVAESNRVQNMAEGALSAISARRDEERIGPWDYAEVVAAICRVFAGRYVIPDAYWSMLFDEKRENEIIGILYGRHKKYLPEAVLQRIRAKPALYLQ